MGDPVTAALAVGSAGMSMAGGISGGIAKKTASQIESAKLKFAADAGRVRGQQIDAGFREELSGVMGTMSAIRSAQGVGFDSPTSFALAKKAEEISDRARISAVSNEKMKALGLEGDSAMTLLLGRQARTSEMLKASGGILDGLTKAAGAIGKK